MASIKSGSLYDFVKKHMHSAHTRPSHSLSDITMTMIELCGDEILYLSTVEATDSAKLFKIIQISEATTGLSAYYSVTTLTGSYRGHVSMNSLHLCRALSKNNLLWAYL